jgi:hypothetical protein
MKRLIALFVLLSGTFTVSARGQLLNFDFTMTSQSYYDYSNNYSFTEPETYTLMGKIIGLQNNASSAPEDVLITSNSFPDHGGLTGFDQNPYSLDAHSFTEAGEFIVSNYIPEPMVPVTATSGIISILTPFPKQTVRTAQPV